MKKTLIASLLFVAASLSASGITPVAPAFLKPGDTIAVLTPSSAVKAEYIDAGMLVLRQWGYIPILGPNARSEWRTFAGTHEQRRNDLLWALENPSVKAIMCTRGGYGSANVLALMPEGAFERNPKWFIGYSDISGYLSAEVRAGNMAIHANMCGRFAKTGGTDFASELLRDLLAGHPQDYVLPGHHLNNPGTAHGIVLGGNMCVVGDIAATKFDFLDDEFIADKDIILFIEEVEEPFSRIDRMLQHFRLRGILDKVKGIIVGRFDGCRPSRGYADTQEMIHETLQHYKDIPICYDFPTGHDEDWNYPLVEGCPATLTVEKDKVTLHFELGQ